MYIATKPNNFHLGYIQLSKLVKYIHYHNSYSKVQLPKFLAKRKCSSPTCRLAIEPEKKCKMNGMSNHSPMSSTYLF